MITLIVVLAAFGLLALAWAAGVEYALRKLSCGIRKGRER